MGIPVLIIGKSGSGKSASLRNFPEAGIINVLGKPMPFKGKANVVVTKDYNRVKFFLHKAEAKSMVIDDAGYLITDQFMLNHSNAGAGNAVFALYNDLGDQFYSLVRFAAEKLSPDKIVYFIMHEDKNDFGDVKPKTIGRLLDEKVCLEGLFTVVLRCVVSGGQHLFLTQSQGCDVQKSPIGMFDTEEIDNDLKYVDDKIREYYEIGGNNHETN